MSIKVYTCESENLKFQKNPDITADVLVQFHSPDGSGSVVVTAHDFESGRPGLNPEWGLIYYRASTTAQGLPEPSSFQGSFIGYQSS